MTTITQSAAVDCAPKDLIAFLSKPANLVSTSPSVPSLFYHAPNLNKGVGQTIYYTLSYGLFQVTWQSSITKFEPNQYFEDTLTEGPFKSITQKHHFESREGKTIVTDEITYDCPAGGLAKVMDRLVISYQIHQFLKEQMKKATMKFQQVRRQSA